MGQSKSLMHISFAASIPDTVFVGFFITGFFNSVGKYVEGVIITVIRSTTAEYILHPAILRQREAYCEASFSVVHEVYLHDMQLC